MSWKRVALAFAATMLSVYTLSFVLSPGGTTPSILWMISFVILSNAIWWTILLYPEPSDRRLPR